MAGVDEGAQSRPTMREVAALAGVSLKTVSRVINAEPAVSSELASRVHAAIERLDYRHNRAASSLRRSDGRSASLWPLSFLRPEPSLALLERARGSGVRSTP